MQQHEFTITRPGARVVPLAQDDGPRPFAWTARHRIALLTLCCVQLLEAIDLTVANVALPTIKHDLGFSQSDLQWVVNAYAVTFGGLLLLGGRAGDLWGRRRVLLLGVGAFGVASLASALAQDPGLLIASRAVQGIAAAFSMPMTLGMLASIFPEGAARNRAVSLIGMVAGLSASLGLVVGGLLVSGPGWRWIFLVNVPIALAIVAVGRRVLPAERPARRHSSFDAPGAILVTAGLSLLAYAVVQTNAGGWGSAGTIGLLLGALVLLVAFVVNEARIAHEPLVPFALLRNRSVTAANVASMFMGTGLWAMFYFTALYQQQVLGHTALATGVLMLPLTALFVVGAILGPMLVPRIGVRYTTALGATMASIGLLLFSRSSPTGGVFADVVGPALLLSPGIALMFIPLTVAGVSGVAGRHVGVAAGLLNTTRQVTGAVGFALIATLATSHTKHLLASGQTTREALSSGFDRGYLISAGLMLMTALTALALFRNEGRGEQLDMTALATVGAES